MYKYISFVLLWCVWVYSEWTLYSYVRHTLLCMAVSVRVCVSIAFQTNTNQVAELSICRLPSLCTSHSHPHYTCLGLCCPCYYPRPLRFMTRKNCNKDTELFRIFHTICNEEWRNQQFLCNFSSPAIRIEKSHFVANTNWTKFCSHCTHTHTQSSHSHQYKNVRVYL